MTLRQVEIAEGMRPSDGGRPGPTGRGIGELCPSDRSGHRLGSPGVASEGVGTLEAAAMVVTILVAVFNVTWTLWSQRRDRAQRSAERAEERERWVASGHIVSLKVIHVQGADGDQWAQLEVRNTGRGPCTIDEVGSWYSPGGPAYGYYCSERDTGYELERDSTPLPHVLEGGRKADWFLALPVLRSTALDTEHGARLHLYVELQNGERHTIPFPISPSV